MEEQTNTNPSTDAPSNDISKTTIVVLVLVTLMISVIGTWTVLNEISTVKAPPQKSSSSGKIALNILPPDTPAQKTVSTTGHVALEII